MKTVSQLTLSLCTISVVSTLLFCILPENNGYKKAFKAVSGIVCAVVIFNTILTVLSVDVTKKNKSDVSRQVKSVEEFVVQNNTEAYLKDVSDLTTQFFEKYGVNCLGISVDIDSAALVFYVDKGTVEMENELSKLTNVNCLVMVGENDE